MRFMFRLVSLLYLGRSSGRILMAIERSGLDWLKSHWGVVFFAATPVALICSVIPAVTPGWTGAMTAGIAATCYLLGMVWLQLRDE